MLNARRKPFVSHNCALRIGGAGSQGKGSLDNSWGSVIDRRRLMKTIARKTYCLPRLRRTNLVQWTRTVTYTRFAVHGSDLRLFYRAGSLLSTNWSFTKKPLPKRSSSSFPREDVHRIVERNGQIPSAMLFGVRCSILAFRKGRAICIGYDEFG